MKPYNFYNCSGLTGSIPAGLFDNVPLITNFGYTFDRCSGLTSIPSGLFNKTPLVTAFYYTFQGCGSITSSVPTLWNSHPGAFHGFCFEGVISASNYASIPADWM